MMEFGYWTTGTSLFPMDLGLMNNPFLSGILLTTSAAARWTTRHLDFSSFPVNSQIVFTEPRVSEDELLLSKVGDSKEGTFGVGFVPEYDMNNFHYGSAFIRGAINIEDRNGLGES